ncbi:MAG: heavy metal translocating P-type ATPase [Chloroflexota bacterium]
MTTQTFKITGMDCAGCAKTVENGVAKLDGIETCELSFSSETLRVSGSVSTAEIVNRVEALGFGVKSKEEFQTFKISGMDCAGCAKTVKNGVAKLDGIEFCELSFASETLRISGKVTTDDVIDRVEQLGFGVSKQSADSETIATASSIVERNFIQFLWQRPETRMAFVATLLILPSLILHEFFPGLGLEHPLLDAASVLALALAGWPIARSGWRAFRINREVNINSLMTIAAVGAVIIGEYTEAGVVMVLFVIGEALEGYTAERARNSIRSLMAVAPNHAERLLPSGETQTIPIGRLAVGDKILVKPGEAIPMDGRVLAGESAVNQASITGESKLIEKENGSEVFASSINGDGTLEIEVTHLAEDNTIARLIKMVEEAQDKRSPAQRLVDRFAAWYTPAVVILAALVAIIPPLMWGAPFFNPSPDETGWLYRALTLLVVACPCALVISTPASIVAAISNGARNGILIKGGAFVEAMASVNAIAFDKTGTLTEGEPKVVKLQSADCDDSSEGVCDPCQDLLALASAVEARSQHPIAVAVTEYASAFGVANKKRAENVRSLTGRGVTGQIDGREVVIGSHRYFDQHLPHGEFCDSVAAMDALGLTTMLISQDAKYQGYIAVADEVRPTSKVVVAELKAVGLDHLVMLTGDNEPTAAQVANEVGVKEFQANCLPEHKASTILKMADMYGPVAMVGDGINDAPALATANVGIAIGNTAQAMETADISLMGNSLTGLPYLVRLARGAMNTIRVNIIFSLAIKFIFLILVVLGTGSMWMAILADMGTSVLVTLNGTRLLYRDFGSN